MICGVRLFRLEYELPNPPSFSYIEMLKARSTGEFEPVFFEWYKFVGNLAHLAMVISPDSEGFRQDSPRNISVLTGLINRCCRLMLANIALSHQGKFGETTLIVDRCIFESAVKISWLCNDPKQERFDRFVNDGLRADVEFKQQIEENIAQRGQVLLIEKRMLNSINKYLELSETTEESVNQSKRMPKFNQLMDKIGRDELQYLVRQKLGSHHVHGTWSSLLTHYLEPDETGKQLVLRDHDCPTDTNQYVATIEAVLQAVTDYVSYAFPTGKNRTPFINLFSGTYEEIMTLFEEASKIRDHLQSSAS